MRRPVRRVVSRPAFLALTLAAVLSASACGGNEFAPEPPPVPSASSFTRPPDPGPIKITVNNANDIKLRPNLVLNRGAIPTTLETKDIIPGTGRTATPTDTVTINYVGVIARTGQEFEATWDSGQPATLSLTEVIPGFQKGIAGMKENGRRQIIMPPDQAYGAQGSGSLIGPDESLIFVVDLLKIN